MTNDPDQPNRLDDAAWADVFDSDSESTATTNAEVIDIDPDDDDPEGGGAAAAIPDRGPSLVAALLKAAQDLADFNPDPKSGFDRPRFAIVHAKRLKAAAEAVIAEDDRLFREMLSENAAAWAQEQIG